MSTTTAPRTLSQRRAAHAWDVVKQLIADTKFVHDGKPTDSGKKLGGQMKKLPTRIIAAGLGQALSFLRAKGQAEYLERALSDWLLNQRDAPQPTAFNPQTAPTADELLDALVNNHWSSSKLRQQTAEALAYLPWLIRFAEAQGLMERSE